MPGDAPRRGFLWKAGKWALVKALGHLLLCPLRISGGFMSAWCLTFNVESKSLVKRSCLGSNHHETNA